MGENHTGSDAFLKTSFDVLLGRITLGGESYWVSCIVRITLSLSAYEGTVIMPRTKLFWCEGNHIGSDTLFMGTPASG